jgi:hypothetical protein
MSNPAQPPTATRPGTRYVVIVVALFAVTATLALNVFPIVLGALLDAHRINAIQLGQVATAEYFSIGIMSAVAGRIFSVNSVRPIAATAAVVNLAANLLTTRISGDLLIAIRVVAGASAGILLWIQYEYVARATNAARLNSMFTAAFVLGSIVVSAIGSAYILPRYGVNGMFVCLAVVAAATAISSWAGPQAFAPLPKPAAGAPGVRLSLAALCALFSVFLMNAFQALTWVYWEPITAMAHLGTHTSELAAVLSLACQLLGALLGAALAGRLPFALVLAVGSIAFILQVLYLLTGASAVGFVTFAMLFGTFMYFLWPFQIELLIAVDESRRALALFAVPMILGAGCGPLLASFLVSGGNIHRGLLLALGFVVLSPLAVCAALLFKRSNVLSSDAALT